MVIGFVGEDAFEKQLSIEKVVIVGIRIIYCNYISQHKCTVCSEIIRGFPTDSCSKTPIMWCCFEERRTKYVLLHWNFQVMMIVHYIYAVIVLRHNDYC